MNSRASVFNIVSVVIIFAFMYLPILLIIAYSFNESRLVTVWGGFSTKWYGSLISNRSMRDAALVTLLVGITSATAATVLGTMAAVALAWHGRFRGRMLLTCMIFAPIVMPEIITGLSLLLLFVAIDVSRGFWTVMLAHVAFSMCFVAVTVQARLMSYDRSLEEAACDLGCPPLKAFFLVTLPIIAPAVFAGWMLAFILSIDNLVISSFVAGPGSTTLPIRIYSAVRLGITPEINALSTIMIGLLTVFVAVISIGAKLRARHQ